MNMASALTKCVLFVFAMNTLGDDALRTNLQQKLPHLKITQVRPTPMTGIHEVILEDQGAVFHVNVNGSYLIAGDLYELGNAGLVNLTEARREVDRSELLAGLDVMDMIVFKSPDHSQATIYVFTDVDCPFCKRFHGDVTELNRYGVEVRYLAYPRAGIHSETYRKMVSAWCSENPHRALTNLKLGRTVPTRTCDNPVANQLALGNSIYVEGTPTIITEKGKRISGYVPAKELATRLGVANY